MVKTYCALDQNKTQHQITDWRFALLQTCLVLQEPPRLEREEYNYDCQLTVYVSLLLQLLFSLTAVVRNLAYPSTAAALPQAGEAGVTI